MKKLQLKWISMVATFAMPLLSHAGPITSFDLLERGDQHLTDLPAATFGGVKDFSAVTWPQELDWKSDLRGKGDQDDSDHFNPFGDRPPVGNPHWDRDPGAPDCGRGHLYDRITPNYVPDSCSTTVLLGLSLLGLAGLAACFPRFMVAPAKHS